MKKYKTLQELFSNPRRWTKGSYAKNKSGDLVSVSSEQAVCFCLYGGADAVYGFNLTNKKLHMVLNKLTKFVTKRLVIADIDNALEEYNDHPKTTIKDIQSLVKEANV